MAIENTRLRADASMANKVRQWMHGEDIGEWSQPGPKRKRSPSPRTQYIEVEFVGLAQFHRLIPQSSTIADLYSFAFRGMKGQYPEFDLRHNNVLLSQMEDAVDQRSLALQPKVAISAPQTKGTSVGELGKGTEASAEIVRESALIKVYRRRKHLFSYWVPRANSFTFASIIFRYWRYCAERHMSLDTDVDVWTELRNTGDGQLVGTENNHWTSMMPSMRPVHGTGILGAEPLCPILDEVPRQPQREDLHKDTLVLKVALVDHQDPVTRNKKRALDAGKMSRLDTSKYIFDNFVNRALAYNLSTHMGLITFSTKATLTQGLTHALEDFRDSTRKMLPGGDTCIWDALALANSHLTEYAKQYPQVRKRIVCLSDGVDNSSVQQGYIIARELQRDAVVVDSVCIGNEDNAALRTVSLLTNGYKFVPKSLDEAMAMSELEPFLNLQDRASASSQSQPGSLTGWTLRLKHLATPDVVSRDIYPQRKQHPNLGDQFIAVSNMSRLSRVSETRTTSASTQPGSRSNANVRPARLLAELRNISANPHPYYEIFVSESDIGFWKVLLQGPPESPYEGGTFLLYLHMDEGYPALPPKGRLCTPILHPNINRHGRICHSILDSMSRFAPHLRTHCRILMVCVGNWTADTSNVSILNTIYSLLLTPEFSDPV